MSERGEGHDTPCPYAGNMREALTEIDDLRTRLAEAEEAVTAVLLAQPMSNGAYVHLVTCSGDRREPAGTPGHSCSCAIAPRSLLAAARRALEELEDEKSKADARGVLLLDEALQRLEEARAALEWAWKHAKESLEPWSAWSECGDSQREGFQCWGCDGEFISEWRTNPRWIKPTDATFPHGADCAYVRFKSVLARLAPPPR